jgi:nicotinate-nucleotide pyrophosphorylase (carboxylating)
MTLSPETLAALAEADLDASYVEALAAAAVEEDLAGGVDVTSVATVPADLLGTAAFVSRASGVVAGIPVAMAVLDAVGDVEFLSRSADGVAVTRGTSVLEARGPVRALLTAERSALNLLCHLSGVATLTRAWADAVDGTGAHIRDTRKTTPGLRLLEKYAVRCGGGVNHRMALSDAALVKDNHVIAAGGVVPAFEAVRAAYPDLPVEVEVTDLDQLRALLDAGCTEILLDNMSNELMAEAVRLTAGRATLEASGGLTLHRAREVAATGVDFISVGALTHSVVVFDLGLDLVDLPAAD